MNGLTADDFPWKRSRFGFAVFFHFTLLAACFVLRLVLYFKFGIEETFSARSLLHVLLVGFHQDFAVALVLTMPLLFWLWIIPDRVYCRLWQRVFLVGGTFVFWTLQVFLFFIEYYFFREFRSRLNKVIVDCLFSPTEVFGDAGSPFPLTLMIILSGVASAAWVAAALVYFRQMWFQPTTGRSRFAHFAVGLVLTALVVKTASLSLTPISANRAMNEIANNGVVSLVASAYTRNLDYAAFYRTLPRNEAWSRVRRILAAPDQEFVGGTNSIRRKVMGDPSRPRLNVVILLEHSIGSEFWGCLGSQGESRTPEMDRLAGEEGLLFTHILASGYHTVRGFEAVFSSFPPLPGDAIVRRDRSENVESLARVLKRDGYSTLFLYGGRGLFDGMRSYALRNGWDRFIEQKDFASPGFTTIWGVCDEEVLDRAIQEFRVLANAGKPFFGTVLSLSTHKPYTYPNGRIPENPDERKFSHAVKYSDWSLGRFFEKAKKESYWGNTLFVVVADQGTGVFGRQGIPVRSYEVPLVILGPAVVKEPRRITAPGSLLDVPTTILGLIGRPYETLFFGRDLLNDPPEGARALLNRNRDIGLFARERMVVLGLQKTVAFYKGDPGVAEMQRVAKPTPEFLELEKDATAIYQVADELYMNRRYRIDGEPAASSSATNAPAR
jgi:phosphoglycerol transferase MdoB-like AlkP superfamily enzyme